MNRLCAGIILSTWLCPSVATEEPSSLTLDEMRAFTQVFGHVQLQYIDDTDDRELLTNAIQGMLSGLDKYTTYLSPAEYQNLTADSQAQYGGVGIEVLWQQAIGSDPAGLRVIGVRDQARRWRRN